MTLISFAISLVLFFQNPVGPPAIPIKPLAPLANQGNQGAAASDNYALGPGDQIMIRAVDVEEIDKQAIVVDRRGNIDLPIVGKLQAAGLTPDQLEVAIAQRLTKILVPPDVSVSVTTAHKDTVSILGAVLTPGVHELTSEKTLFETLSLAGGLRPDAGYVVFITRRIEYGPIPLPNAAPDATGQYSVASVSVNSIMAASNPAENIVIKPNDVISIPPADIIYVIGAVKKPGGFALNNNGTRSTLQILSLAEGLERTAAGDRARIMRKIPGSDDRDEIPIDLRKILSGKISDMPLRADDILFVPVSTSKAVGYRTLDVLSLSATALIYRVP